MEVKSITGKRNRSDIREEPQAKKRNAHNECELLNKGRFEELRSWIVNNGITELDLTDPSQPDLRLDETGVKTLADLLRASFGVHLQKLTLGHVASFTTDRGSFAVLLCEDAGLAQDGRGLAQDDSGKRRHATMQRPSHQTIGEVSQLAAQKRSDFHLIHQHRRSVAGRKLRDARDARDRDAKRDQGRSSMRFQRFRDVLLRPINPHRFPVDNIKPRASTSEPCRTPDLCHGCAGGPSLSG